MWAKYLISFFFFTLLKPSHIFYIVNIVYDTNSIDFVKDTPQ